MIVFSLFVLSVFLDVVFHCWLIFVLELWQVKAKCTYCQMKCGQEQPGVVGRKGLFLETTWCHGTISRMIHIYLVRELELKEVWRDGIWGSLSILGTIDFVCAWVLWCFFVMIRWGYTLWLLKLSGFSGTSTVKVMYYNATVLLCILVSIKWNQYKDMHLGCNDQSINHNESVLVEWEFMSGKVESFSWPNFEKNFCGKRILLYLDRGWITQMYEFVKT